MKNNRNNQIMLILYFILVIFLLIQLYELYSLNNEHFYNSNQNEVSNVNINSIMLSPYEDEDEDEDEREFKTYFGTFIKNNDKDDIHNSLYLYKTTDLNSPKWNRVDNMLLEKNKKVILTDISFDKSKRMIVIGLYYKNDKPVYNIYRKETDNMNSKWVRISTDVNIRSICYDINNDKKIIGISSYDGQIYFNNGDYMNWIGPINYSKIPMRKIMYNPDDQMIGIGLFDNYIYKKKGDWKNTDWDNKPNKNQTVRDLILYNGELIATTSKGIMIQTSGINSEFTPFSDYNPSGATITDYNIFKSKLGFGIDNKNLFDTENNDQNHLAFIKEAEATYDLKKNLLDFCAQKKYLHNKNNNTKELDEINLKHQEINELYKKIEVINTNMTK